MSFQGHAKLMLYLWYIGFKESLQLHRCVVLMALDEEHLLGAKVWDCVTLHGAIFLGSMLCWQYGALPALAWLLQHGVQPAFGAAWAQALLATFTQIHQVLWMIPAYLVTLIVSCTWYNDIARRAVHVRQKHAARLEAEQRLQAVQAGSDPAAAVGGKTVQQGSSGSTASGGTPYESVAEELYRVVLFLVLFVEVSLVGFIPIIGPPLYLILSCWLYAYYCYDYQWALRGMRVQDRLALFEGCAPFFAGYGLLLASLTLLPFFLGGALVSLLFPIFVIIACDSNVSQVMYAAMQPAKLQTQDTKSHNSRVPSSNGAVFKQSVDGTHPPRGEFSSKDMVAGSGHMQRGLSNQQVVGSTLQQGLGVPSSNIGFRLPVFSLAAWPTQWVLRLVFGAGSKTHKAL